MDNPWIFARVLSAVFTGAGFLFGLSERAVAYVKAGCPTLGFSLLMCAAIFALVNAINYPWEVLRRR
jgi:hypothetical protein